MKSRLRCLGLFLGLVLSCQLLFSQVNTATVYGTVIDSSGAAVAGSVITITNTETTATVQTTSGGQGEFTFTFVPVGTYTMSVEGKGFKTYRQSGLQLEAGQRLQLEAKLELGD